MPPDISPNAQRVAKQLIIMASALSGLMMVLNLENTGSVQKCHIIQLKRFIFFYMICKL